MRSYPSMGYSKLLAPREFRVTGLLVLPPWTTTEPVEATVTAVHYEQAIAALETGAAQEGGLFIDARATLIGPASAPGSAAPARSIEAMFAEGEEVTS